MTSREFIMSIVFFCVLFICLTILGTSRGANGDSLNPRERLVMAYVELDRLSLERKTLSRMPESDARLYGLLILGSRQQEAEHEAQANEKGMSEADKEEAHKLAKKYEHDMSDPIIQSLERRYSDE